MCVRGTKANSPLTRGHAHEGGRTPYVATANQATRGVDPQWVGRQPLQYIAHALVHAGMPVTIGAMLTGMLLDRGTAARGELVEDVRGAPLEKAPPALSPPLLRVCIHFSNMVVW